MLVAVACARKGCDLVFHLDSAFQERRLDDHRRFYCPHGHINVYKRGQSRISDLDRMTTSRDWYRTQNGAHRSEIGSLGRSNAALRGVITRQRKKLEGFLSVTVRCGSC